MLKDRTIPIDSNPNAKLYISLLIAMFIWGISWPSAKIVGRYADAELLMFWRFVIGAMTMLPIMYLLNIKADLPKKSLRYVFIASICLVGYNYNYLKGTQIGMAGLGVVIVPTLSPLVTFILAIATLNQNIKKKDIIGILFGICGVRRCQISSVIKGIKGCSKHKVFSNTYIRVGIGESWGVFVRIRTFASSTYQSQNSDHINS